MPTKWITIHISYRGTKFLEGGMKNEPLLTSQLIPYDDLIFKHIVERMKDVVWTTDINLNLTYVSPSVLKVFGFTQEERMKQRIEEMVTPESLSVVVENMNRELEIENQHGIDPTRTLTLELEYYKKDGSRVWMETIAGALRNDENKLNGFYGVARDITERKLFENKLKASEERYRLLLQNANDAVFVHEVSSQGPGLFIDVNDQTCRMLGYSREELLTMTVFDVDAPEMREKVPGIIQELFSNGHSIFEAVHLTKDGRRIPVEISARLFYLEGRPTVLSVIRDMTERLRTEHILRDSETRFRLLVENAPEALFVQTEGQFAFVNPATVRLFGADEENDLLGKSVINQFHPDFRDIVQLRIKRLNERLQKVPLNEEVALKLDGTPVDIAVSAVPIHYNGKNGALVFARDITERKIAERERRIYTERLEAILKNIPVMIAYPDKEGHYQWVNRQWEKTYGWSLEEAKQLNGMREHFRDEEERQRVIDFIRQSVDTGKWEDFKSQRKDGTDIDTTWSNISLTDGSIIGIGVDITDRKRMEHDLQASLERLRKAIMGIIRVTTNVVEVRDPYTAGHERRVADLSRAIAQEMELPPDHIEGIYMASSIHDIGKIAIPSEILSKPGKLSSIEYLLIKTHPQAGYDILKGIDFPWGLAEMVYQHHERFDGSGYPNGLKGEQITLGARIIAVADTVEAMASHRPYRPGLGLSLAMEEIEKNRNIHYDCDVVDACLKLFREKNYQLQVI